MTGAALATGLGAGAPAAAERMVPKDRSTIARPSVDSDDPRERREAYTERSLERWARHLSEADLEELNQMRIELEHAKRRARSYYEIQMRRINAIEDQMRRMGHDGNDPAGRDIRGELERRRQVAYRPQELIHRAGESVEHERLLRLGLADQASGIDDSRDRLRARVADGITPEREDWNILDREQQRLSVRRGSEGARREAVMPQLRREVRDALSEPEQE